MANCNIFKALLQTKYNFDLIALLFTERHASGIAIMKIFYVFAIIQLSVARQDGESCPYVHDGNVGSHSGPIGTTDHSVHFSQVQSELFNTSADHTTEK